MRRLCLGLILAGFAATVTTTALDRDLGDAAIDEAVAIARRARTDSRGSFHASYVFRAGAPPITSVSLVTEFRRLVIAAEEQANAGNHMWGIREGRELLQRSRNALTIVADVDFHPQNTYVTVPGYAIRILTKAGIDLSGTDVRSTPKYGLRSVPSPSDPPYYPFPPPSLPSGPGAEPLTGAWVEATFSAGSLDPRGLILVIVSEGATDLARVSVDLAQIR